MKPDFPKSTWQPPKKLPSLKAAKMIAVDLETRDPGLRELGPSTFRGGGYVVGVSLAVDGWSGYLPMRHEGGDNLDVRQVKRYLKDNLKYDNPKLGAYLLYDLEWLRAEGIKVNGLKYDVQIAEPLLDEDKPTYRLDALAEERLGVHKEESLMVQAASAMGIKEKDVKENLWRLPARFVGPYGDADAVLPFRIFEQQEKELKEQGLWDVFILETRLVDLLLDMRFQGVPVDLARAEQTRKKLLTQQRRKLKQVKDLVGFTPNVWANEDLEKLCKKLKVSYPHTDKQDKNGKYHSSFTADWLDKQEHETLSLIREIRKLDRAGGTFIQSKILNVADAENRVHPQYWQVRHDQGGTKRGRFSSSNPNMQQVPARDPVYAPMIRSLFIPEEGEDWGKFDYSQQEPRVTVHYAYLLNFKGAAEARRCYIENPDTDYHQMVADWISEVRVTTRRVAKDINLGLAYGMGIKKLAGVLNIAVEDAKELMSQYHRSVPYIKPLGDKCQRVVKQRGFIKTILGRRQRFQLFGPPRWEPGIRPLRHDAAIEKFGRPVVRYFLHKAMNALVQGSSADMIKKAMLDCYEEGIVPLVTVHDELGISVDGDKKVKRIHDIMLNCVKLEVPLKVDVGVGRSWGEMKKVKL